MDVKLLHPVWKDFLDTVNTVVLSGYRKQLIIFLFDIQCFFQSGSECHKFHLDCRGCSQLIHVCTFAPSF